MEVSTRDQGPRPYKSRRDRPCDLCRARKIACRIDSAPPCAFCHSRGSECTFREKPINKRRRTTLSSNAAGTGGDHFSQPEYAEFDPQHWEDDVTLQAFDGVLFEDLMLLEDESPPFSNHYGPTQPPTTDEAPSGNAENSVSPLRRLDSSSDESGFYDLKSLRRSQLPPETGHLSHSVIDGVLGNRERAEIPRTSLQRTRFCAPRRRHTDSKAPPILLVSESSNQPLSVNLGPGGQVSRSDIETLLSEKQRAHLVRLFFQFVQPAFPVLQPLDQSDTDGSELCRESSLALAASVYATALPFSMHDDHLNATLTDVSEKRERLYSIAIMAILAEAHAPCLEDLQACLLLLQKGPTVQHQGLTPTYAWFTSLAVTMARCLGLQHDCRSWSIALSEKQLRTRLWWATVVMDLWVSVDSPGGRSISPADYDVPALPADDGDDGSDDDAGGMRDAANHFYHLVNLTGLLSQIYETYYTVRATKDTATDLFKSLEFARPLRSALNDCRQRLKADLPLSSDEGSGINASVHLACAVVSIVLFRALLRPLQRSPEGSNHVNKTSPPPDPHRSAAALAIVTGSINSAREAVQLLEGTVSVVGPWNSFWHSWSQGNFAIISTFLVQLVLVKNIQESRSPHETNGNHGPEKETETAAEIADLISRWKRAIRVGAGSGGWGSSLMSMALSRLDSLLNQIPA